MTGKGMEWAKRVLSLLMVMAMVAVQVMPVSVEDVGGVNERIYNEMLNSLSRM